jgi:tetratricopeptide (TPR) repeat protein
MLDVLELEKRWLRYRLKKLIPLVAAAAILFIAGGTMSYLYVSNPQIFKGKATDNEVITEQAKPVQASVQPVIDANKSIVVATAQPQDKEQNVLKPSFDFMYNIEDQVINYNNAKAENKSTEAIAQVSEQPTKMIRQVETKQVKKAAPTPKKKTPVKKPVKVATKTAPKKSTVAAKPTKSVIVEKKEPVVEKSSEETIVQISHEQVSEDELNSVIKRFNKQNNPALSLFIAKTYYDRGNYKEAYNYALVTNNLNPSIEDSVLIFARSLVKLGKKEDAIKTLDAYIGNTSSINAKILLNEIQKGKFK